jgi:hypothetical protein
VAGYGQTYFRTRSSRQLKFYYEDAYDGMGGPVAESIFEFKERGYLARARMLTGNPRPPSRSHPTNFASGID